eukprot:TRINITY_DN71106_c0_g1_i1.p1 TRINITY_DN71106_c0_g1~~TRINITY_DN71106_c0_g1_i1.p1  ORF type:complete len:523 (+),score=131.79 TRINITY_DN71106_c0_g1_i1:70-1638(+)
MAAGPPAEYDLVLRGGRVIDPETGLDGVRDVAISGGVICRIAAAGAGVLRGREEVRCEGKVVCPGFIDQHSHVAGHAPSARLQALDGVTTQLELEFGHYPIQAWYDGIAASGGSVLHYGSSAGHIMARIAALEHGAASAGWTRWQGAGGPPVLNSGACQPHLLAYCHCTSAPSHQRRAAPDDIAAVVANLAAALDAGAIGIGMGIAYTECACHAEVYRVFELAAQRGQVVFVHNRGEMVQLSDMHELFADAAATGAALQICHLASSCGRGVDMGLCLEMIDALNARGAADVSCEQYPYTAGLTRLDSGVFKPGWQKRLGIGYQDVEWCATGQRIADAAEFARLQAEGGLVLVHSMTVQAVDKCISHPRCMIASDAVPLVDGRKGHPRGAGCFCRVLGWVVRERGVLALADAIRKMTLQPAQRLEGMCSAMRRKGRLQEGCDADICVFDPAEVSDRATFADPAIPSHGVWLLLVKGRAVVRNGAFNDRAPRLGDALRADARPRKLHDSAPTPRKRMRPTSGAA